MPTGDRRPVVIGLGNPLMGDDGAGLAALAALRGEGRVEAELVDGGTWGMNLLPVLESADHVLLLDAIDQGTRPGTVIELDGPEIPRFLGVKLSPHQIDLREVLALAELRGTLPRQLAAIGIQPARIELGTSLSAPVAAAIPEVLARVGARLASWQNDAIPEASCTR